MPDPRAEILHIALPVPVRHHFDYLPPRNASVQRLCPGMRVHVPFGRNRQTVGLIVGTSPTTDIAPHRLKAITGVIDEQPLFDPAHLQLLRWAGDYYHYPLGELIFSTLPAMLRLGKKAMAPETLIWRLADGTIPSEQTLPSRSIKQRRLLELLKTNTAGLSAEQINPHLDDWREAMRALIDKGLAVRINVSPPIEAPSPPVMVRLNDEQQRAFASIRANLNTDRRILLDGVTGSGKTEIYLETVREVLAHGKQAIILVPEIGLTPQLISRFRERVQARLAVLHSGLADGERLSAWLAARDGSAGIVLGTRSAIWTPLKNPGLFIIDEEHDPSYKQQESFRYSARDIAILRAANAKVPIILGSATPSLESLHNVDQGRFERLALIGRAQDAALPAFNIIDMKKHKPVGALSEPLLAAIEQVLAGGKQVLLYLNRRGYAPVLMCEQCDWTGKCERCETPYTVHKQRRTLICHHCGSQRDIPPACPECGNGELVHIGHGTERLYEVLEERFPSARIARIDRDSTRRKGSMEQYLNGIRAGEFDILVGTQMLAKGHHLPGITLVGIIDADRGLYSADFRAGERMAQNIIQVSGRAGRAGDPGRVMIQTRFPDHPLLGALIRHDYHSFARLLLEERKAAHLPPFSCMALLRAESHEQKNPFAFLEAARALLPESRDASIEVFGPFPAPVEKRAGKYRFQLLLQSGNRAALQKTLHRWIGQLDDLREAKKIRWSVDVDPQEML